MLIFRADSKTKYQFMRKSYRFLIAWIFAGLFSIAAYSQTVTISGNVRNNFSKESVPAVTVSVKGTNLGTFTDERGNFKIAVPSLPVVLVISSASFETKEITVNSSTETVQVDFEPSTAVEEEVIVAASRVPQRILQTPVTIERMGPAILRNLPAPNPYEAINNIRGVDMHTASLTFRTVTTRGFISSGNTRLNQLIDGMDNQAPGLNFSVGSVIGPTELDLDNIEILSGASSALYGSGGMNGTILITSKNPFQYQGLSFNVKQGIMHVDGRQRNLSPYYDWAVRYAKAFNNKFAFKVSAQFIKANDWQADDYRNIKRTSVISKVVSGNRQTDPNYDGINMYGDETSLEIREVMLTIWGASGMPATLNGIPSAFFLNPANLPRQFVSRSGYEEKNLVDYNTMNIKFTGGLHYKITPNIEASLNSYMGTGTTVYTGADRYSLRNLKIAQHKLEIRGRSWFARGYTTQENAGDAYNATILGRYINEAWKPSFSVANIPGSWYPQYVFNYLGYKLAQGANANEYNAHLFARAAADQGRLLPGTTGFNTAAKTIRETAIPAGGKFLDRSDLYAAEGQFSFSDALRFSDKLEVLIGGGWKQYVLNSSGTIFSDTAGQRIKISETGGFIQLTKKLFNEVLTLTAAGRYDKHVNFDGRFTPRVSAVVRVAPNNFLRASYQTGYRFPTNQSQYINLITATTILIGGFPEQQAKYGLVSNPAYIAETVDQYRENNNPSVLKAAPFTRIKPESISSYELGFKGLISKKLLIDLYGYMSTYTDLNVNIAAVQPRSPATRDADLRGLLFVKNISYPQNSLSEIKAQGWGFSADYRFRGNYSLYGNIFSDILQDVPAGEITFFNAPKYRWNIGLRNENFWKNIGFNVVVKWQDNNYYEGTFVTGTLPYFTWVDAQVSYHVPKTKSLFRIGGTNIGNSYYRTGFGSPYVGGLYYISYGYNIL